jgi:Reverse transcriptase (RNA-dependent DNA polymerase)
VLFRRYADDSIVCFERKDDAEAYLRALPERLAKFGLQLAEEKSALVKFNRWEGETSGKFTFHRHKSSRNRWPVLDKARTVLHETIHQLTNPQT